MFKEEYSNYYNLIYKDKNYSDEALFVSNLLEKHNIKPGASILELGSGTGKHGFHLAEKGYFVTGIDQSAAMVKIAHDLKENSPSEIAKRLQFYHANIQSYETEQLFDAAISLFHVMSYQITNEALTKAFHLIKKAVKPDGIFIFDCWYGPAVLTQQPQVRFKTWTDNKYHLERVAVPAINLSESTVNVHYHLFLKDISSDFFNKTEEEHKMRYLFENEIKLFCSHFNMSHLDSFEWMSGNSLGNDTWGACFVIRV